LMVYPNPATSTTQINFSLENSHSLDLSVFDSSGRKIETLLNSSMSSGTYSIPWNVSKLASGTYLIKLQNGEYAVTNRCQVLN
jgi:hypothetical protein